MSSPGQNSKRPQAQAQAPAAAGAQGTTGLIRQEEDDDVQALGRFLKLPVFDDTTPLNFNEYSV